MPSEDATSTVATVLAQNKIDPSLFGQYVGSETVITMKHGENWLYILKGEVKRSFDEFECAIDALEAHLTADTTTTAALFLPVLGTHQPDKVLLGVDGIPLPEELFDMSTGQLKADEGEGGGRVEVWRMQTTVPPRKRHNNNNNNNNNHNDVKAEEETQLLLIPGLKRLSKQLHVDFAINVHSGEGKRKREPTRSIYNEAAMFKKGGRGEGRKKKEDKAPPSTTGGSDCAEFRDKNTLKHSLLSTMMESVSAAHTAALEAKDEIIRNMAESHEASIKSKDRVINAQAALIATLQAAIQVEKDQEKKFQCI